MTKRELSPPKRPERRLTGPISGRLPLPPLPLSSREHGQATLGMGGSRCRTSIQNPRADGQNPRPDDREPRAGALAARGHEGGRR
jgi:hypothetical protein